MPSLRAPPSARLLDLPKDLLVRVLSRCEGPVDIRCCVKLGP